MEDKSFFMSAMKTRTVEERSRILAEGLRAYSILVADVVNGAHRYDEVLVYKCLTEYARALESEFPSIKEAAEVVSGFVKFTKYTVKV